ncbi:hypothetical protein COHA_000888 [Chlorella ohadii]|uniref:U4/U6.U5 small nuclear ribonucleoprotein 27kDa protein domain-containing protein n=1 Tax=Chlorella ohadii TaxID=2649997 RepID=A0AAD5H6E4_9CHLO|nr:hypothetical protein COHA_000888 [Chlorella ohadii]
MSATGAAVETAVLRSGREKCWQARDAFYKCVEDAGVTYTVDTPAPAQCKAARAAYEAACKASWPRTAAAAMSGRYDDRDERRRGEDDRDRERGYRDDRRRDDDRGDRRRDDRDRFADRDREERRRRSRSRSRSRDRRRDDRERSYGGDRDRERRDRERSERERSERGDRSERSRRSRSRSRSREGKRRRSRSRDGGERDRRERRRSERGFDTSQGKKHEDAGAIKIKSTRGARQYMNRRGGFNRSLDGEGTGEKVRIEWLRS